ncbi:hypothetical protein [Halobellus sp. EA9]|uniref:hypothetical protein n=1 Tax=Halobellus sp. EA9 TaxID=3421647 RepID=UPI003EB6B658
MTLRDTVWDEVLREITRMGYITVSDLPFEESQQYTVRRTLKEMEEAGWLRRRSSHTSKWCLGKKAEVHLNASRDAIQNAREIASEE